MKALNILAFDFGSSSMRAVKGEFDGKKLCVNEEQRHKNQFLNINGGSYINIFSMHEFLINAVRDLSSRCKIDSVAVDTWGLDFGLFDENNNLIGLPRSYRDARTKDIAMEVYKQVSAKEIFAKTGISPIPIWTLFQLYSMKNKEAVALNHSKALQFIPNILDFFLTGELSCERSFASISLLYNITNKTWDNDLRTSLELPDILPPLSSHGEKIGDINAAIWNGGNAQKVPVQCIAHHDTACAFASIPVQDQETTAYVSCGSICIVGTNIEEPIINDEVFEFGFINQSGFLDIINFSRHFPGLVILQECERIWSREGYVMDYEKLNNICQHLDSEMFFDIMDITYLDNILYSIEHALNKKGFKMPQKKEEIYACIVNSIAREIADNVINLAKTTNKKFDSIHMVGGGVKNGYLCERIEFYTHLKVSRGLREATALGNLLMQLVALKEIEVNQIKEVLKNSRIH